MGNDFYKAKIQPYAAIIVKICRAYTYSQADFDDYYQEVCFQVWRSRERFKHNCSWSTWIYKIALNVCLTYVRKGNSAPPLVSEAAIELEGAYFQTGNCQDEIISLYKAIHQLADLDKAIILLYLEQFSNQEIAEVIGVTVNNIGVRVTRIKKKLNNLLNNEV